MSTNNSVKTFEIIPEFLKSLPTYGTIKYDPTTHYWYIELPSEWSHITTELLNYCQKNFSSTKEYKQCFDMCRHWYHCVEKAFRNMNHQCFRYSTSSHKNEPHINWVSPPSCVGYHISLGTHNKNSTDLPYYLVENKKIKFNLKYIKPVITHRDRAINLPGQRKDSQGYRYYPTYWILLNIEFINLSNNGLKLQYDPHISLACLAVSLNLYNIDLYNKYYINSFTENNKKYGKNNIKNNDNTLSNHNETQCKLYYCVHKPIQN